MTTRRYLQLASLLSGGGAAFAGTLSAVRLLTKQCALSEPCPTFLGQPACYTGFALFLALFMTSTTALAWGKGSRAPVYLNLWVSLLGVAFALPLTGLELATGHDLPHPYPLGLPSCAYGLVFFVALAVLSGVALAQSAPTGPARA